MNPTQVIQLRNVFPIIYKIIHACCEIYYRKHSFLKINTMNTELKKIKNADWN